MKKYTRYDGISLTPKTRKWSSRIIIHGERRNLGLFDYEQQAIEAYNDHWFDYHGERPYPHHQVPVIRRNEIDKVFLFGDLSGKTHALIYNCDILELGSREYITDRMIESRLARHDDKYDIAIINWRLQT
jgi:hypothetical protein